MLNEMFKNGILINLKLPPDAPLILLTTFKAMWFQPTDPYSTRCEHTCESRNQSMRKVSCPTSDEPLQTQYFC